MTRGIITTFYRAKDLQKNVSGKPINYTYTKVLQPVVMLLSLDDLHEAS